METVTVGRAKECDIVINDPHISRVHAKITFTGDKYIFNDVSSNGSTVNGQKIYHEETLIDSNSSILLAHKIPLFWSKIEDVVGKININEPKTKTSYYSKTEIEQKNHSPGLFKQSFSLKGRINRKEYVISLIIYTLYIYLINIIYYNFDVSLLLIYILGSPGFWFMIAQGTKRCHDLGNSGWYQLIPFYPLWMLFEKGEQNVNKYDQFTF